MTREELIAALGRAEGPSRELDAHIWKFDGCRVAPVPRYTSSLDAALTLLPQNDWLSWKIEGGTDPKEKGGIACVAIWSERDHDDLPNQGVRYGTKWRTGVTPAIALCLAALKARAP